MFAKFAAILVLSAVAAAASEDGEGSTADFSSFSYAVSDPYTGDYKHQIESRAGDNVNGQYSLIESDGSRRIVDYAAGAEGFNAIVRKEPAVIAAPIVAAKAIATPIVAAKAIATPIVAAKTIATPLLATNAISPYYSAYPYAPFYPKFAYPYAYARYY